MGVSRENPTTALTAAKLGAIALKLLIVACVLVPASWAAENAPVTDPAVFPQDVAIRNIFRKALSFSVAQAATVPISIVQGATFGDFNQMPGGGMTSNTFGTVYGVTSGGGRLLPAGPINDWGDDFVDGMAPTSLNGVRVLINGKASFLSFVGRSEDIGIPLDQINFVSPDDTAVGPVSIEVFQGQQMVAASMVNRGNIASPGLFAFGPRDGVAYAIAVSATGELILPANYFPGVTTRPAASGETIILFGTGYGATDPPVPAGKIVTILSAIPSNELTATIGGLNAGVGFGGLAPFLAGVYQFNIVVPQLSSGNHLIQIGRSGINGQAGLSIPVANP